MLRLISRWYAKLSYRWGLEVEGEKNVLNARLAVANAQVKRDFVAQLTAEADDIEATITRVEGEEIERKKGDAYQKLSKKEKYEDNRQAQEEKTAAVATMNQKRDMAKKEAENVAQIEQSAQYFKGLAANAREVSDKIKRL